MGERRILVVEEEDVALVLYRRLLAPMPLRYDMARTLAEARRRMAEADGYDLLVTDLRLPDGLGTEILGEFHHRFPKAKVLIVTGSLEMTPSAPASPGAPETEWIYKPFEIDVFTAALKRLLSL